MTSGIDVSEHRAAHRRALAPATRRARSNDLESVTLREHRMAHRWNLTHEEISEKRRVPAAVPWDKQIPLCMGEGDPDE